MKEKTIFDTLIKLLVVSILLQAANLAMSIIEWIYHISVV